MASIGISFGTVYSCISIPDKNGIPEAIANEDGFRQIPSYVAYNDVEVLCGTQAKQQALSNPKGTINHFRPLLGKRYFDLDNRTGDKEIKEFGKAFRVPIVASNEDPALPVFEIETFPEGAEEPVISQYSVTDVTATYLKKLKDTAEYFLSAQVDNCVISIPAHFEESQKKALLKAAHEAGFKSAYELHEPVAAVMAFNNLGSTTQNKMDKQIVVLDLGAESFNITLISNHDGLYTIEDSVEEQNLGGNDFDKVLAEFAKEEFKRKTKMDISDNKRSLIKLQNACERTKRALTRQDTAPCSVESLYDGIDFNGSIPRARFDMLAEPLYNKCKAAVLKTLKKSNLAVEKVDQVVLIGGSSRMPRFQAAMKSLFPNADAETEFRCDIEPDEAIALGCAVQAQILLANEIDFDVKFEKKLIDAEHLSKTITIASATGEHVPIIPAGTPLPVRRQFTLPLGAKQTGIYLSVFESDSSTNSLLGEVVLSGLPDDIKDGRVEVVFLIELDHVLQVTITEKVSGEKDSGSEDFDSDNVQSEGELDEPNRKDFSGLGTVESVTMVNFMCHKYLEIKLGEKLNFIVGHNGSGKSAILTALTVALGGKASFTNRATSISKLLKEGEEYYVFNFRVGEVIVRIRNRGPDAYKHEEYGDTIVVERKIAQAGSASGYKMKSHSGKLISTRHDELMAICDHLQIEVDNPMAILTQDTARMFLSNSTPKDKYNVKNTKPVLFERHSAGKDMEMATKLEGKINELQAEQIWSRVAEVEKRAEDKQKECNSLRGKISKVDDYILNTEQQAKEFSDSVEELKEREQFAKSQTIPLHSQKQEIIAALQQIKSGLFNCESQKNQLQNDIQRQKEVVQDITDRINRENKKMSQEFLSEKEENERQLCKLNRQSAESLEKIGFTKHEVDRLAGDIARETLHEKKIEANVQSLRQEMASVQRNIKDCEAQKTDKLAAYMKNMAFVVGDVNECERLRKWSGFKPVGPIGIHVKLNQKNSAPIYKYDPKGDLNYYDGQPSKNLKTVLDVLTIDNQIALEQLIINNNIEKAVLVDTMEEGDSLNPWPRNVSGVFTPEGHLIGGKQGGLSTASMSMYRGPPRLSENVDEVVRELQYELGQLKAKYDDASSDLNQTNRKRVSIERQKSNLVAEIRQMESARLKIERVIREREESINDAQPVNIDTYINLKNEETSKLHLLEKQVQDAKSAVSEISEAQKLKNAERSQILKEISQCDTTINSIQAELSQLGPQAHAFNTKITHYINKKNEYAEKLAEFTEHYEVLTDALQKQIESCNAYCERVEITRPKEEIDEELKKVQALLREKEKQLGSREALHKKYTQKKETLDNAIKEINDFKTLMDCLLKTKVRRERRFESFRSFITIRATRMFAELIRKRGYRGVLSLDHAACTLSLNVDVENTGKVDDLEDEIDNDPRALSGGEKSYATVCLLLALWEAMASPFRALDEFDVFMDAVNRRLAMKLMIDNARDADVQSQYILITPQNMSNINMNAADIRVHLLKAPERGQQTLDFSRARSRNE
ncbi:Structural maintenance of chromosomes protein 6 [Terramyces sp. JEL0728]|nr:Structural maintenance of chromosomes protein 6 [Terramyces sp. JEL0728]